MNQAKFVKDSLLKLSDMVCYQVQFFKGSLPQILLVPFLNILLQMILQSTHIVKKC